MKTATWENQSRNWYRLFSKKVRYYQTNNREQTDLEEWIRWSSPSLSLVGTDALNTLLKSMAKVLCGCTFFKAIDKGLRSGFLIWHNHNGCKNVRVGFRSPGLQFCSSANHTSTGSKDREKPNVRHTAHKRFKRCRHHVAHIDRWWSMPFLVSMLRTSFFAHLGKATVR